MHGVAFVDSTENQSKSKTIKTNCEWLQCNEFRIVIAGEYNVAQCTLVSAVGCPPSDLGHINYDVSSLFLCEAPSDRSFCESIWMIVFAVGRHLRGLRVRPGTVIWCVCIQEQRLLFSEAAVRRKVALMFVLLDHWSASAYYVHRTEWACRSTT